MLPQPARWQRALRSTFKLGPDHQLSTMNHQPPVNHGDTEAQGKKKAEGGRRKAEGGEVRPEIATKRHEKARREDLRTEGGGRRAETFNVQRSTWNVA